MIQYTNFWGKVITRGSLNDMRWHLEYLKEEQRCMRKPCEKANVQVDIDKVELLCKR